MCPTANVPPWTKV
uniref:Uncharacterized protein n=1 Tax=Anopheles quadriannulatus TaxID=34691 RepID=A0A182XRH4_ANOQN